MNITHAKSEEVMGDKLEAIFERQKELMVKYHDIEKRSGLLQTSDCPINLDDKRGQARIKDFSWRVTEELGEALDAFEDKEHFREELVDGLHFLTELTILAGVNPDKLLNYVLGIYNSLVCKSHGYIRGFDSEDTLETILEVSKELYRGYSLADRVTSFVENIGMTCNCLKNKPWKQSNMITDKEAFYHNLSKTWIVYLSIMNTEMDAKEIVDVYFKKSQVNKFRQRSNY